MIERRRCLTLPQTGWVTLLNSLNLDKWEEQHGAFVATVYGSGTPSSKGNA